MNLPVQNLKSITDDFRAVYSYFVFPRVRCRFFAHLRPNKPKSLFCPIQERRKPSERGKNGMKVRFSRIFLQIGWSKRPQDIVFHFHHCVKHLPSRIPKKKRAAVLIPGRLCPCLAKLCRDSAKTYANKRFGKRKGTIAHLCAAGCGAASPTLFVICGRRPRGLLIDRLDYSLDYSLDYGYQKSKCLCGFSDFHNIDFFTSQHRLFHFTT